MSASDHDKERRSVLLTWLHTHGRSGGYDISRGTGLRSFRMYPLLTKLELEGLVLRTETSERVYYELTPLGVEKARELAVT